MSAFRPTRGSQSARRDGLCQRPHHRQRTRNNRVPPHRRRHGVRRGGSRNSFRHDSSLHSGRRQSLVDRVRRKDRESLSPRLTDICDRGVDSDAGSGSDGRHVGAALGYFVRNGRAFGAVAFETGQGFFRVDNSDSTALIVHAPWHWDESWPECSRWIWRSWPRRHCAGRNDDFRDHLLSVFQASGCVINGFGAGCGDF
jgi:hypothetical protein